MQQVWVKYQFWWMVKGFSSSHIWVELEIATAYKQKQKALATQS